MTAENRRTLIVVVRKTVFAGLVLLLAWLALLGLRGAIPASTINQINVELSNQSRTSHTAALSLSPWSWDWSHSIFTGKSVAQTIDQRLGPTLSFVALAMLLSVALALIVVFVGMLIGRRTKRPAGLAKTTSVLRLLIISAFVSVPFFLWQVLIIVYPALWWHLPDGSPVTEWISAFLTSLLPIWLLVQYGRGEITKRTGEGRPFDAGLWRHLSISLIVRALRLVGAIIVLGMFVELGSPFVGVGSLFVRGVNQRDFPVIFGIVWTLVVIVVVVKLVADLIEITYKRYSRPNIEATAAVATPERHLGTPQWWLYVGLGLVAASIIVAVAAPLIAPYGNNEMTLAARLLPPSSQHILGTDNLGRDVFSRIIFGIRDDVLIGLVAAGIMLVVATGWAMLMVYWRKSELVRSDMLEDLVMMPRDALYACPWLVLLLLVITLAMPMSGSGTSFVIALALMVSLAVLPRAVGVMQEAYQSPPEGGSSLRAILRAVPIMILFVVAGGILYTASATYLGVGLPPPTPELGGMLSGAARQYMLQAPWMVLWPQAILALLLLAWVMAGESLLEIMGFKSKAVWSKMWE